MLDPLPNFVCDKVAVSRVRSPVGVNIFEIPQPFRKAWFSIQFFPEIQSITLWYIESLTLIPRMDEGEVSTVTLLEYLVIPLANRNHLFFVDRAVAERSRPIRSPLEDRQRGNVGSGNGLHDLDP
jgi:hypothetical protein